MTDNNGDIQTLAELETDFKDGSDAKLVQATPEEKFLNSGPGSMVLGGGEGFLTSLPETDSERDDNVGGACRSEDGCYVTPVRNSGYDDFDC